MKITSQEIRTKYLKFMESKGHKIIPSSPLIPENDPTTLFTGSGMQPMVPYLLGEKHPLGTRICDSQKSFRTGDIDDIGDNRHTTFFEMLGNWSLGDYFKKEQIEWMFEFLTKEIGLNPKNLYVSAYIGNKSFNISKDEEAANTWKEQFAKIGIVAKIVDDVEINGMQDGKIFYYKEKENWWSRAGVPENMPVGEPGGPDSEMFWDFGEHLKLHENSPWKDKHCHPNCDCGRFLEIGNNVFMQFKKVENGFEELKNKNIDFGGGLERLSVAVNNDPDVFLGNLFDGIRNKIETLSGKKYGENPKETKAFRVIMDHLRASTFLIADGALPSNKDQGYFTRRLLRRAVRFAKDLGINSGLSKEVALEVIKEYQNHYTDLLEKKDLIVREIEAEEKQFLETLEKGLKEFDKLVNGFQIAFEKTGNKVDIISGDKAFKLYDTFGFPIEMTIELAGEKNLKVDVDGFQEAFKKHKDLSRAGAEQKFKGGLADTGEITTALHSATHLMLAGLRKILGTHVHQAGSNITAERLRFDFTHTDKMTDEELKQVENYVNNAISANAKIILENISKVEAQNDPQIEASFWEKYPDIVKVYTFKDGKGNIYSKELCGGPHVEATGNMGKFKILKEEASSRGVRRIKAVLEK
ncbi:MAG: alanine--tRNA ligase [Candidatus Gracilibacteria bacterium]|nr:alanine--tRNA ligase [Candidatus Gracilibacteria bacterium]